ncbi:hypothetical protein TraAM80_08470 [Trypanosoma rangeli]|uniref:Uncharacterized protein n=1 Tax=Trypanosoma rangeli TaxID=5698 RepID=A0A3R7KEP5_TRYRA|nr:uncharacterized protein TraAM80_08470 [Trypanosoma rangeli]RNE98984.1 hypothetical protein TraAM80_08470 [Trypanosoma rangeli]|eukprot:RNE98984.1 hypothetical protein TraAM80_08470 [Trypanosoma rangeli]
MQPPFDQAASIQTVLQRQRCESPFSTAIRSGPHSRLSQLRFIHLQEADRVVSVDGFFSVVFPCTFPESEDDTRGWVERLRKLMQKQRVNPSHCRWWTTDETSTNRGRHF